MLIKCIDGPAKGDEYEVPAYYRPGDVVRVAKRGIIDPALIVIHRHEELFDRYVFDGESLKAA